MIYYLILLTTFLSLNASFQEPMLKKYKLWKQLLLQLPRPLQKQIFSAQTINNITVPQSWFMLRNFDKISENLAYDEQDKQFIEKLTKKCFRYGTIKTFYREYPLTGLLVLRKLQEKTKNSIRDIAFKNEYFERPLLNKSISTLYPLKKNYHMARIYFHDDNFDEKELSGNNFSLIPNKPGNKVIGFFDYQWIIGDNGQILKWQTCVFDLNQLTPEDFIASTINYVFEHIYFNFLSQGSISLNLEKDFIPQAEYLFELRKILNNYKLLDKNFDIDKSRWKINQCRADFYKWLNLKPIPDPNKQLSCVIQ